MLRSKRGYVADSTSGSQDLNHFVKIVKKMIGDKNEIHELDFAGKSMNDENLRLLSEHLETFSREFPTLQVLKLTYNDLTHASMDALAKCLKKMTSINSLDLAENNIGIKGCVKLSKSLRGDIRSRMISVLSIKYRYILT